MYEVEMKDLTGTAGGWELIEWSWESPNRFAEVADAELCARTLALRHDGDKAFRVVGESGVPLVAFHVIKQLQTTRPGPPRSRKREVISPGDVPPMLYEVLPERPA